MLKFNLLEAEMIGLEKCDNLTRIKPEAGFMNLEEEKESLLRVSNLDPTQFLPCKEIDVFYQ